MNVSCVLIRSAVGIAVLAARLNAAPSSRGASAAGKPILYNYVGERARTEGEAHMKAVYGGKFKIVDFGDERSYIPAKITHRVTPEPVVEFGQAVKGHVLVVFVVTADGRVKEPLVLRSTNRKLNQPVLDTVVRWRCTPARLRGVAVPTTLGQDFDFK